MKHPLSKALAFVAGGVLLASLTGCASGSGGSSNDITVWYRPGSLPSAGIKTVKEKFPDAKITLIQTPDVDTKIASALRSNSGVPDIAVATLSNLATATDKIVNVDDYGFKKVANDYLDWKVKAGQTPDGKQIGIPIDIGPAGFFYRADVMEQAGLPSEPDAVGKEVATWDGYKQLAEKLASTGQYICDDTQDSVYAPAVRAAGYYYYSKNGKTYEPDTAVNKEAFIRATEWNKDKLCLDVSPYEQDWNAGVAQNKLVGWVGPAYQAPLVQEAAAGQSGKWRVATPPGGASAAGGSSLSVFKASKNPKLATEIAEYLTSPENQTKGYAQDGLFPSTPSSYKSTEMTQPDKFFGGQVINSILGPVAEQAPTFYSGQNSPIALTIFNTALTDNLKNGSNGSSDYEAAVKKAEAQAQ
ncbi:extracellular solute-binding protein (plasmid) [Curtobacterium sp. MCLR17_007]|uniref:ABC transporter substrate-binding protein n=1 Tax=Curtobacterium sp. MCLR17_007 TaxID=2175648 RepID=UPI0015E8934C|nr:extracellular solute-binding protein [Curtobacterium sp. MCLR17_007]WIB62108.1 extracellular solute-binding protein [Curtobacterium sp. MCLR17_007]